jgi:hypothetical protein
MAVIVSGAGLVRTWGLKCAEPEEVAYWLTGDTDPDKRIKIADRIELRSFCHDCDRTYRAQMRNLGRCIRKSSRSKQ